MAILTYNIQDFVPLAQAWFLAGRKHCGIILSEQFSHPQFGELLCRVLRLLNRSAIPFALTQNRNRAVDMSTAS